jgi:hypothetical protein
VRRPAIAPWRASSHLRRLYQARLRSDYGDMAPTTESEAVRAAAEAEAVLELPIPLAAPDTAPEG